MKKRTGFVSNSSSASFQITWKCYGESEELTVEEAIKRLMEFDDSYEYAVKQTKKIDKNVFQSSFWTCMMNSYSDFGITAMAVYFALSMQKSKFEILAAKVEED